MLLDCQTGQMTCTEPTGTSHLRVLGWDPHSSLIWVDSCSSISPAADRHAAVYDTAGRVVAADTFPALLRNCVWAPDSSGTAACAADGLSLWLWDLQGGKRHVELGIAQVHSLIWAPDSQAVCCLTMGRLLWISRDGVPLRRCTLAVSTAFASIGLQGVATLHRGQDRAYCVIKLFSVEAGPTLALRHSVKLPFTQFLAPPAFCPDGSLVACGLLQEASEVGGVLHTLVVISMTTAQVKAYQLNLPPHTIRWRPDGAAVIAQDSTGRHCAVQELVG